MTRIEFRTWETLFGEKTEKIPFFLEPYIPQSGTIFLFGATSLGKSPLIVSWARAIGAGQDWFGLPVKKGRVLIVETDGPRILVAPRFQAPMYESPGEGVAWAFCPPLGVPNVDPRDHDELKRIRDDFQPTCVFFNTLRTLHQLKDIESHVPSLIYSWARNLFPGCSLLFTHHPKKTPPANIEVSEDEMFSGNNAFRNDAQVALHLQKREQRRVVWVDGKKKKVLKELYCSVRLRHTKSQVSPLYNPLPLLLAPDGANWRCPPHEELVVVEAIMKEALTAGWEGAKLGSRVAAALQDLNAPHSPATVARRIALIREGRFPGTPSWLGLVRDGEEGDSENEGQEEDA